MLVITTCAQTFIIYALQQSDSCYFCSHCIWDWCFSLGDYTFRPYTPSSFSLLFSQLPTP